MPEKTFTPEQVVGRLRQIEVLVSQGKRVPVRRRRPGHLAADSYHKRP